MADQIADVIRLFILENAFLGGSKRGQAALATDTKRWVIHNDSDDTLAFAVSDDSLQLLLADAQNVAGVKTFLPGINVVNEPANFDGGFFGIFEGDLTILNLDGGGGSGADLKLETSSGSIVLKPDGDLVATVDLDGILISNDKRIVCAPSNSGSSSNAGLKLPHGTAPNTPEDGEMWTTTTGLFVRINGVTVGPLS